jgi:hypothetical protein
MGENLARPCTASLASRMIGPGGIRGGGCACYNNFL